MCLASCTLLVTLIPGRSARPGRVKERRKEKRKTILNHEAQERMLLGLFNSTILIKHHGTTKRK